MNIFQLSCFLAVAEHLNFAKAAEQLHVTHPAVSQQIQALEKELNVKLFIRTTRSVRLTEEGRTFLNDARQMVAISERAKKRFESAQYKEIDILSVGSDNFPSMFVLADTLEKLRAKLPDLHPRLQVIPFRYIYRMLEEGDLDVVVGFKESFGSKNSAIYKEIIKVPMVCVCSADHPLSRQSQVSLKDLKEEKLVLFLPSNAKASHPIAQMQGELMGGKLPSEFYFCESAEVITVLVTAGYGVSVLPDILVPQTPEISKIPLAEDKTASFGVYYKSLQGNPALKAFVQCVKESLSS